MSTQASTHILWAYLSIALLCFVYFAPAQNVSSSDTTQNLEPIPAVKRVSLSVRTGYAIFSTSDTYEYLDALKNFPRPITTGIVRNSESSSHLPLCIELDVSISRSFSIWGEVLFGLSSERAVIDEQWKSGSTDLFFGGKLYGNFKSGFVYGRAGLGMVFNTLEIEEPGFTGPIASAEPSTEEFKGSGLGFVVGGGGGLFITSFISLNCDISYRNARVEELKDDNDRIPQWKETVTQNSHSIEIRFSDSKEAGFKTVPVDFSGFQITIGAAIHF
ncbi:MAG: hypothetical protein ABSB78_01520 [Bacteroidota bacterium]